MNRRSRTQEERRKMPSQLCVDRACSSELLIDFGEGIVDLSNLVSPKTSSSSMKVPPLPMPARRPRLGDSQKKSHQRLYPSADMVIAVPDLRTEDLLAKCCVRRKPMPRETEGSDYRSHTRNNYSTSYATPDDHDYEQHTPGAYNMKPSTHIHSTAHRDCYNDTSLESAYCRNYERYSSQYNQDYQNNYDRNTMCHGSNQCSPAPPPKYEQLQVEICPGVYEPLRGSEETWHAIQRGYANAVNCFNCSLSLLCIADAEYVLCPDCRVVGPAMAGDMFDRKVPAINTTSYQRGGVGLGLRAL